MWLLSPYLTEMLTLLAFSECPLRLVSYFFTLIFPPTHAKSRETNITPLIKQHVVDLKIFFSKNLEQGKDYASFKSEKFLAKLAEHR
jgi:hypothetical protein